MEATAADSVFERTEKLELTSSWISELTSIMNWPFEDSHANFWITINAILTTIVLYFIYTCAFKPMNRVKRLEDIGYIPDRGQTLKETANLVRKRRQAGDIPPVYPNGWFGIAESSDIDVGQVKAVSCLGKSHAYHMWYFAFNNST